MLVLMADQKPTARSTQSRSKLNIVSIGNQKIWQGSSGRQVDCRRKAWRNDFYVRASSEELLRLAHNEWPQLLRDLILDYQTKRKPR
jgi:hypothetical protein